LKPFAIFWNFEKLINPKDIKKNVEVSCEDPARICEHLNFTAHFVQNVNPVDLRRRRGISNAKIQ
jgi:hypothetical protein